MIFCEFSSEPGDGSRDELSGTPSRPGSMIRGGTCAPDPELTDTFAYTNQSLLYEMSLAEAARGWRIVNLL